MISKPEQIADPIETFDYSDAEIVIGLVCAVGTDYGPIRGSVESEREVCPKFLLTLKRPEEVYVTRNSMERGQLLKSVILNCTNFVSTVFSVTYNIRYLANATFLGKIHCAP